MCLFKKHKTPSKEGVHTEKGLSYLCNRGIKYASLRTSGEYGEIILGRNGYINFCQERIIICCEGKKVFDRPIDDLTIGELLSKNGATFTFYNPDIHKKQIVTGYYTDYRK